MLISEFARKTGLTTDTVRFYVRRGPPSVYRTPRSTPGCSIG